VGTKIHRVAIVGCGRLGQYYAEAYSTYPDTEIAAIAEFNPERREAVGKRFGVEALYPDVHSLLQDIVPDIVAVVTPTRYYKEAVIACAEAGVKGVSTDKPIAAVLSDADEMVEACESRGVVYAGGNLPRALNEVQEAARMLRSGEFGKIIGASVQGWGVEISGAGCQYISVMRLLADAEVEEVIAWAAPQEVLDGESDDGLAVHAKLRLTSGVECAVFGHATSFKGVDVWSADSLVRWKWGPPELYKGFDADGARRHLEHKYAPYQWSEYSWLTGSIRSFLAAVEMGTELGVSGHDLRQALEVAIAAKLSARLGNVPIKLPLVDRSLSLYPTEYRWSGGDATGRPQSIEEAAGPPRS
jgi:predicted dehydrogenase